MGSLHGYHTSHDKALCTEIRGHFVFSGYGASREELCIGSGQNVPLLSVEETLCERGKMLFAEAVQPSTQVRS